MYVSRVGLADRVALGQSVSEDREVGESIGETPE